MKKGLHSTLSNIKATRKQNLKDKVNILLDSNNINEFRILEEIIKYKERRAHKLLAKKIGLKSDWNAFDLMQVSCQLFKVNSKDLMQKNRSPKYVNIKKALSYVLYKNGYSEYDISFFIKKDRTTILYYLKCVQDAKDIKDRAILDHIDIIQKEVDKVKTSNLKIAN